MRWLKGNRDVVAPTFAPMLHTAAMPGMKKHYEYYEYIPTLCKKITLAIYVYEHRSGCSNTQLPQEPVQSSSEVSAVLWLDHKHTSQAKGEVKTSSKQQTRLE